MILLSSVAGFVWVCIYRLIEDFRYSLGRSKFMCRLEDLILAVCFAFTTYIFMYKTCGGVVRGFNYLMLVLGIAGACLFFSKLDTMVMVRRARKRKAEEDENKAGN